MITAEVKKFKAFGREREVLVIGRGRFGLTVRDRRLHALYSIGGVGRVRIEEGRYDGWDDWISDNEAFSVSAKLFLQFVSRLLALRSDGAEARIEYDWHRLTSDHGEGDVICWRIKRPSGWIYTFKAPCGQRTQRISREDWKTVKAWLEGKVRA